VGTSNWQNISYNLTLVKKINPHKILDVGVGFGRWGILFREILEIWDEENYSGKWNRQIDGVEIFEGYLKEYHRIFYTNIYRMDIRDFINISNQKYDLINCGDVIEHLDKTDGIELIKCFLERTKYLLINLPLGSSWEQEMKNDNPYEKHLSGWSKDDFYEYENKKIKYFRDIYFRKYAVVLISKTPINIENEFRILYGRYFHIKKYLKHLFSLKKVIEWAERKN
jgi:hypothetical protein